MKNATKEEQQKIAKQLDKNAQRGQQHNTNMMFAPGMQNLFAPQPPMMNNQMFGQQFLPNIAPRPMVPMMVPNRGMPMYYQTPQQSFIQQGPNIMPPQHSNIMPPQHSNIMPPQHSNMKPNMMRQPQQQSMFQQPPNMRPVP